MRRYQDGPVEICRLTFRFLNVKTFANNGPELKIIRHLKQLLVPERPVIQTLRSHKWLGLLFSTKLETS